MCWKYQYFYKCEAWVNMLMFSTHEMKYVWYLPKKSKFSLSFLFENDTIQISLKKLKLFSVISHQLCGSSSCKRSLHLENGAECHFNEWMNHKKLATKGSRWQWPDFACRKSVTSAQYVDVIGTNVNVQSVISNKFHTYNKIFQTPFAPSFFNFRYSENINRITHLWTENITFIHRWYALISLLSIK